MIKKLSFWLIKPKMTFCRGSGGILRELDQEHRSWLHE